MPETHRRLRREDRGVIYRMNQAGKSQREIAQAIGFSQGTVSKELCRNRGLRGYRPAQAQRTAESRRDGKRARRRSLEGAALLEVERRLRLRHSPEQISGALDVEGIAKVSHETIYRHVREDRKAGGKIFQFLRINGKRRYRRRAKAGRYNKIPGRIGIEERPASVENRTRYGDWEVDLIEGRKGTGYLLSMYERKTRTGLLRRLDTKGAKETSERIVATLKGLRVRTLTYDNGAEFSRHQEVSAALGARGFFCNAYHSWEKGGVENFNGLVRQYYPKGSSFADITAEELRKVESALNDRPRKTLGFTSPSQHKHKIAA
jgi:IS30 family transposase